MKAMHPSAQLMFRLHDGQAHVEKWGEAEKHLKQLSSWAVDAQSVGDALTPDGRLIFGKRGNSGARQRAPGRIQRLRPDCQHPVALARDLVQYDAMASGARRDVRGERPGFSPRLFGARICGIPHTSTRKLVRFGSTSRIRAARGAGYSRTLREWTSWTGSRSSAGASDSGYTRWNARRNSDGISLTRGLATHVAVPVPGSRRRRADRSPRPDGSGRERAPGGDDVRGNI